MKILSHIVPIFCFFFTMHASFLYGEAADNQDISLKSMKTQYQIIYLNGPSSSGKTTLAKALQQELDQPFLHIGIDRIIGMMPAKMNNWEGELVPDGFSWKASLDEMGYPIYEMQMGPFAQKISDTLKEIVLTMAKMDHYIIIDDVAFGKEDVDKWRAILSDYKVLWIGIHTPLPLLEERERQRGNRILGSARAQYYQVHSGVTYDLDFDTSKDSLKKISQEIKEKLIIPTK
jgi:chloramphenicol 3-O phosphotransferase